MRLHLVSLPHTITHSRFSSCAFTGKVLRFSPMLQSVGYEVVHYGVQGAASGAKQQVDVLTYGEWCDLGGREPGTTPHGSLAVTDSPLYRSFNERLVPLLRERLQPQDVICLPYGHAHSQAMLGFPDAMKLETGIGYPAACEKYRVYESYAWMHYHLGKERRDGCDYWWVIPNYYDPDEWPLGSGDGGYLVYLGRLNRDKGLDIIWEVAKARPDLPVILCGQGDPSPWLTLPNMRYLPPIHGAGREKLLGDALCTLMPTRYVEPFGGVTVESLLCGTPVLASSYGSFTETIDHGVNGFRCRTLADWLEAVDSVVLAGAFSDRQSIRRDAVRRYSMWALAREYDRVFHQLADLWGEGWYALRPLPTSPGRPLCQTRHLPVAPMGRTSSAELETSSSGGTLPP
jgi:glycosyltransferase involved in cell wall biosynthesis